MFPQSMPSQASEVLRIPRTFGIRMPGRTASQKSRPDPLCRQKSDARLFYMVEVREAGGMPEMRVRLVRPQLNRLLGELEPDRLGRARDAVEDAMTLAGSKL